MMNTPPKSMTIAFLALSIFISGLGADLVRAQSSAPEPMVTLTPEEQAWLRENPHIKLATLTNQPPFSMMDAERNHTGILADILAFLSDAIGRRIETKLVERTVSDIHEVAKEEGIYGSASILKTSRHGKEYLLTKPYMTTPYYIYTSTKNRFEIRRAADLRGKRIVVPRNHRAVAAYLTGISGVQTIPADTPLEQMQKVVSGEADALIGYFHYPYLVNKYLMVDLVIAFIAKSDQGICIGVNPEHPVLHGILKKAIAVLDDEKLAAITARWMEASRKVAYRIDLTPQEEAWIKAHPEIALGAPTDYPPMVIKRADGTYVGVLVDIFQQINRDLNSRIDLYIEDSWADIQEKAQNREIDGLAFGGRDPSREALYNATDIVLPTYFSVFARSQHEYRLNRFSDLDGMRIGYKRAARPTRSLLEKLPSAILKPYDGHESLTQALLNREIEVIVAWMSYDHWRKQKLQGTIDKIYLIEEHPIEMVSYIRNDWPELIPILNKAIAALKQGELPRIINKWFGEWPRRSGATRLSLSSEERAWLGKKHAVRVRIVDWPPYLIVKDDQPPQGIVIEYLKLIEERTGIRFKHEVTGQPFAEFLDRMKQRQGPDMTALIVPTPEREQYLTFSETYIASPYVIFIREKDKPILDISGLAGKTLAIPRGFVVQEQLSRDYPEIKQALHDSDEAALQALATGQADAYIGNLIVASHIIHGRGFTHLKVAAASPFGDQALSMGIRKTWPELTSIVNKALASITEEEKTAIRNKYLAIKFEQGINKAEVLKWALIVGGSAAGIIFLFVFWNARLSKETRMRKESEAQLRGFLERMPIAACLVDNQENMYYHNKRFIELFGYKHEEIKTLSDWWPKAYPDDQYRQYVIETWSDCVRRSEEKGTDIEAKEYRVTCKNGQVREMEISGIVLGDRYLATLIDNTERNRAKDQQVTAKEAAETANQAKSIFLASMSHELRTPLNAILGFSGMLAREKNATSDEQQKLSIINRSGQHLLSMINDVLDLSKIEAGSVELQEHPFDPVALIKEISVMIQSRAVEKGLSVAVEAETVSFSYVKADVGKLRQILINLLGNAVKFTDKGGVTIRCSSEPIPQASNHCNIVIEVADTGLGIDPARQDKIFEPFVQGIDEPVRKGTGLGLFICKKYAEFMGGTIELESEAGKGSLFRVKLPAQIAEAADVQTSVDDKPRVIGLAPTEKTWRVLVADDNQANLLLLKSLLEKVGFVVLEAQNGQEAVAAFKKESPDFIWMDMRMPVMDGYEATRRIRKWESGSRNAAFDELRRDKFGNGKWEGAREEAEKMGRWEGENKSEIRNPKSKMEGIPIIAITASAFSEQRPEILAAGCDDMVTKPFQAHEIFEAMGRLLDIEYIYEPEEEALPSRKVETDLTIAMLAALPEDLLQDLKKNSLSADREAISEVIDRIDPLAPDTAKGLRTLLENFQIARIHDLVEEVEGEKME